MFDAGKNRKAKNEYSESEIADLLSKLQIKTNKSKEQAWNEFQLKIANNIHSKERSLIYWKFAVAAGIAIIVAFYFWKINANYIQIVSNPGKQISYNLPDNSHILINAATTVKYSKNNWSKNRIIYLEGEAFFKVKKGSTFKVITDKGTITVIGTSFNVSTRGHSLNVYCESGKVAVEAKDTVYLTAGLKVSISNEKTVTKVDTASSHDATWRTGEFWYNNTPLIEVLEEIERQFNVEIRYNELNNRFYSGYFNTKSLSNALETVLYPMQLNYRVNGNKIQIIK